MTRDQFRSAGGRLRRTRPASAGGARPDGGALGGGEPGSGGGVMAGGAAGALRGLRPRREAGDSGSDGDGAGGGAGRRRGGRVWEPPPARLVSKDFTKYAEVRVLRVIHVHWYVT
jgi:hypothetical protein